MWQIESVRENDNLDVNIFVSIEMYVFLFGHCPLRCIWFGAEDCKKYFLVTSKIGFSF